MSDRTVYQILIINTDKGEAVEEYFTNEHILDIKNAIGNNISAYDSMEDLEEADSEEDEEDDEDLFVDDEDEDDDDDEVQRGEN